VAGFASFSARFATRFSTARFAAFFGTRNATASFSVAGSRSIFARQLAAFEGELTIVIFEFTLNADDDLVVRATDRR